MRTSPALRLSGAIAVLVALAACAPLQPAVEAPRPVAPQITEDTLRAKIKSYGAQIKDSVDLPIRKPTPNRLRCCVCCGTGAWAATNGVAAVPVSRRIANAATSTLVRVSILSSLDSMTAVYISDVLKYRSARSASTVQMLPGRRRASCRAAQTLAPEETPTSRP